MNLHEEELVNDADGYTRTAYVKMKLKNAKKVRPPSQRVQEAFRQVKVLGRTQTEVARELGCTRQNVGKMIKKMQAWLGVTCRCED